MPVQEPANHPMSRRMATVLIVGNLLMMVGGCTLQEQSRRWFENPDLFMVIGTMLMLSSIAVATLLSSWGPGPVWIRALVLSVVICLAALTQVACVYTWQNIVYEFNRMPAGVAFQLASQIANALNLAIPMMIVLSILAAIGRWRIGPPSLHPMQIRIVDVMMGIGVFSFLFAVNPEVQQRYNEIGFSEAKYNDVIATTGWLGNTVISRGDYPTVGQYRFETMMLAAIVAPIAALVTAISAWSLLNRYVWIGLVAPVLLLSAIAVAALEGDALLAIAGIPLSASIACALIAINVRLVGLAGWPLSKRSSVSNPDQRKAETPQTAPLPEA